MLKNWLIASACLMATVAAPIAAQPSLFSGAAREPDPASGLRIVLRGSLGWSGALPNTSPVDANAAQAAWRSNAGKQARTELGLTEEAANQALTLSAPPGQGLVLALTLPSDTGQAREAGALFLQTAAKDVASNAVAKWREATNQELLARADARLDEARKEYEMARAQASEQRRRVRDVADMLDPSPDGVRAAATRLEQERQRIRLEQVGQSARQKALQERVAKLADAAAAKTADDPIAAELERIVKLREAEFERHAALEKTGQIPPQGRETALVQLADARARLLERREAAARSAGTELLGELNKELITLSIATIENEARLDYLGQRLAGLAKASDLVDDLEQAQAATARAARRLELTEGELRETRRQAESGGLFKVSLTWDEPIFERAPKPQAPKQP